VEHYGADERCVLYTTTAPPHPPPPTPTKPPHEGLWEEIVRNDETKREIGSDPSKAVASL